MAGPSRASMKNKSDQRPKTKDQGPSGATCRSLVFGLWSLVQVLVAVGVGFFGTAGWADDDMTQASVDHFFSRCSHQPRVVIHQQDSPFDLHAIVYTTSNLMELEIIRLVDWVVDLPLPDSDLRPIERSLNAIRVAYNRHATNLPMQRFGQLVDAFQLRELSLGDVTSTYTAASGGEVSPGSGTLVRVNKLIDWTQHVVGDLNRGAGWWVRRPTGLVAWQMPGRAVDATQKGLIKTFHGISVVLFRALDRGLLGIEGGVETVVNLPQPVMHTKTTVFLRMPAGVYHAHELWILDHQRWIYAGTPEELSHLTHAELFHHRGRREWWNLERFKPEPQTVILVTDRRTMESAPARLRDYVVPAAWAFGDAPVLGGGQS